MLNLIIEGKITEPLTFEIRKLVVGGLSHRDQAAAQKHLDEAKLEGISFTPKTTPVFLPKVVDRITTSNTIEVLPDSRSSGEVEPVLLIGKDEIYIAAGSDHTDREVEKHDMVWSKQMCPSIISKKVWRYEDIKDHWDDIIMRGWVVAADGKRELYQEGKVGQFMTVEDFLKKTKEHVAGDLTGSVIFMGTIATLGGKMMYSPGFEAELVDEYLGRTLTCSYSIAPITWLK